MKVEKTLSLAIARNLTAEQQKELSAMITEFAMATKNYGMELRSDKDVTAVNDSLIRANAAWSALMQLGLNVAF